MLCATRRSALAVVLVGLAAGPLAFGAAGAPSPRAVSLRVQAGMLMGVNVGGQALPATRMGGFYFRPYTARTGPSVLTNGAIASLPRPLPESFAIDEKVQYEGRATISIVQPGDTPTDSGFLEFTGPVQAGKVYLFRSAHRGRKLGGELPPIIHIREYDASGQMIVPQQNVELLAGSYDWREETFSIPIVEGAVRLGLALHHPGGTGQFWMSEPVLAAVTERPASAVPGQWMPDDKGRLEFAGSVPGSEIMLSALATPKNDGLTITTVLSAPTEYLRQHPQAMVLSFRLPVSATGWRWGDSLRQERVIEAGKSYSNSHLIGLRQLRLVSWFPMGAVTGPRHGLAIMAPLTPTTLNRMSYDPRGSLNVEFDLGLAPRRTARSRHPEEDMEQVAFTFDIVAYDPQWGYRAALESYYQRYPALFTSTAKEGGWWIGPTAKVKDIQDFGLRYSENHFTHAEDAAANNAAGLYTCAYSEPWMWRIETLGPEVKDVSQAPPPLSLLPQVEKEAALPADVKDVADYWPAPRRESVRAFLNSVSYGPDGAPRVRAVRTYGITVIEFSTSPLPKIRSEKWGEANRGLLSYKYETLEDQKRAAASSARVEGVYFDSVGDWSDVSAEDTRPDHFPFSDFPLTFSYATGAPAISGLSAMAQYMQFIREKGYRTMANSDAKYAAYAAPYLDMIGAGENYYDASDEEFSHDRALAYHKSISFGNTGMLDASPEEAERRFRLLLFYHIYPGIFAGDAAKLEAVRPVYQRYVPLMQAMGAAGWEPVTDATVDDAAVWVERYGPAPRPAGTAPNAWSAPVYFALRNPTDRARTVTLSIDEAPFGAAAQSATERLSERTLELRREDGKAAVTLEIAAQDTAVVLVLWK